MDYGDFDAWEISRYDDLGWTWHRFKPNGKLRITSARSFETMEACVENAARYGFGTVSVRNKMAAPFGITSGSFDSVRVSAP